MAGQEQVDKTIADELMKSLAQTLGGGIAQIFAGLKQAFDPLKNVNAAIQAASEKAAKEEEKLAAAANSTSSAMASLIQSINQLIASMGGTLNAVAAPGAKKAAAAPELQGGSGLEALGIAVGGIATAATAAIGAIQAVISKLGEFVGALSPGTMEIFNQSIKSLQATVGVAFQPIFSILADTIRQVAGIILPVMQQLRPVIEQLTQAFASNLIIRVQTLADIFQSLMPIIQLLAVLLEISEAMMMPFIIGLKLLAPIFTLLLAGLQPIIDVLKIFAAAFDGLNQIFDVMTTIVKVLVQMFVSWVQALLGGIGLKDILSQMTQAVKNVINALVIFVATILKFFGISLQPLIDALGPKKGEDAAGTPQIRGFEQISKDLQLAAAASGGTATDKKEDLLAATVEELKKMRDGASEGHASVVGVLNDIRDYLKVLADAKDSAKTAWAYAGRAADAVGFATNPLGTITRKLLGG